MTDDGLGTTQMLLHENNSNTQKKRTNAEKRVKGPIQLRLYRLYAAISLSIRNDCLHKGHSS